MSLATWKKAFYATPARIGRNRSDLWCLKHCLRKWKGLRNSSRVRHRVYLIHLRGRLVDANNKELRINCDSCALCAKYADWAFCAGCPLTQSCNQDFITWMRTGNPEPMIKKLKGAIREHSTQAV